MAENKDKYVDAIIKLIKLTKENKIEWESGNIEKLMNEYPDFKIGNVFLTIYKDRKLRLYRYRYEIPRNVYSRVLGGGTEKEWGIGTKLGVIDNYENSIWEFPSVNVLSDLFKSIQYQIAGVEEFIDDLLNEE